DIQQLTAGSIDGATLVATNLGTVNVKGFVTPSGVTPARVDGDIDQDTLILIKGNLALPAGAGGGFQPTISFQVANDFERTLLLSPPGISRMSVGGSLTNSNIVTFNPLSPNTGPIGSLSAGLIDRSLIRASSVSLTVGPAAMTATPTSSSGSVGSVTSS